MYGIVSFGPSACERAGTSPCHFRAAEVGSPPAHVETGALLRFGFFRALNVIRSDGSAPSRSDGRGVVKSCAGWSARRATKTNVAQHGATPSRAGAERTQCDIPPCAVELQIPAAFSRLACGARDRAPDTQCAGMCHPRPVLQAAPAFRGEFPAYAARFGNAGGACISGPRTASCAMKRPARNEPNSDGPTEVRSVHRIAHAHRPQTPAATEAEAETA
jgi:hypothetical protein